jgi:hypothetical protein
MALFIRWAHSQDIAQSAKLVGFTVQFLIARKSMLRQ